MVSSLRQQSGMTLLEVLVATSLMVIISVISYTSLNGLIDSKIHTDQVAESINRQNLVARQLHKDFKSLINRNINMSNGESSPAISGSYYSVEFSINGHSNPLGQHRSELQRIRWQLVNSQLIRSTKDNLETSSQARWKDRVYLNDISEFNIRYINNSGQQLRRWPEGGHQSIPRNIQITLTMDDKTSYYLNLIPNGVIR